VSSFHRFVTAPTAALCGVTGGVLFAFSAFVMPGLRRVSVPAAVRAMQAINLAAPRSALMVPLIGSALGSLVVGAQALAGRDGGNRPLLLGGAAAGLASFAVTATFHIPRNNALARLDPDAGATAAAWARYVSQWTAGNHVRSALALGAAVALLAGRPQ
jgi:uncharacterized membrane protein